MTSEEPGEGGGYVGSAGEVISEVHDVPIEGDKSAVMHVEENNEELEREKRRAKRLLITGAVVGGTLLAIVIGLSVGLVREGRSNAAVDATQPQAAITSSPTYPSFNTRAPVTPMPTPEPTIKEIITPFPTPKRVTTLQPTPPIESTFQTIVAYLQDNGISSPEAFSDGQSPQSLAAEFMVLDNSGPIPPDRSTLAGQEFLERYSLAVLYYATNGPFWENQYSFILKAFGSCHWVKTVEISSTESERRGVHCDEFGKVSKLVFVDNNVTGTIPTELLLLTDLKLLRLQQSNIGGSIPSFLQDFLKLTTLDIRACNIIGPFPEWISRYPRLEELILSDNVIEGTIPEALSQLSDRLLTLRVDSNLLTGSVKFANNLTELRVLHLERNMFQDTIDDDFLPNQVLLRELDLSNNQFDGTIPVHWFNSIRAAELKILDVHDNFLTGNIPEMPHNNTLQLFAAHRNNLNGTVPESLTNLRDLDYLDLTGNQLTGPMPEFLGGFAAIEYLFLAANPFEQGPIPESYLQLTKLRDLSVKATQRTGTIPTWLGNMTTLFLLDLDSNGFVGTIPTELGNINSLEWLLLNRNELTGQVPVEFATLSSGLVLLTVEENSLSGSLNFLCSPQVDLVADCGGTVPEVNCTCCAFCCEDGTPCHDSDFLANYDPSSETGYGRTEYVFLDHNITRP